ncbi:MAG: TrkA family potassium uptake protein [Spirochaetes bacterium]|nr:TrkA family potassium uptake protein [Spirochaetota bacterium]
MKRQFAILGLGRFGVRVLEKLAEVTDEIIVVDKDEMLIEKCKDLVRNAYVADAVDEQVIRRIIPEGIDAAIVDVGGSIEASILVTNNLKKVGIRNIIVKTDSDVRGEILELVGATRVVYPDREAASQIVPMLVSPNLFSFMPISSTLALAEIKILEGFVGKTLIEANFRQRYGINIVAIRKENNDEYRYFQPDYRLQSDDVVLVAGKEGDITAFTGIEVSIPKAAFTDVLRGVFKGHKRIN